MMGVKEKIKYLIDWRYSRKGSEVIDKEEEYEMDGPCTNCAFSIVLIIKKGVSLKDVLPHVVCENCGLKQDVGHII